LAKIIGIEGMTNEQLQSELSRGGKFVVFPYCISIVIMTFGRSSDIYFIRAGESAFGKGWPFALLSFFLGWWGVPWGLIRTPIALFQTLSGGKDVTSEIVGQIRMAGGAQGPPAGPQGPPSVGPQNPWSSS